MYTKLVILFAVVSPLTTHPSGSDQLYFPEESNSQNYNPNFQSPVFQDGLTELRQRNSTKYELYVDQIISGGIAKLTLAINRAFLDVISKRQENLVFAPVSIGGKTKILQINLEFKSFAHMNFRKHLYLIFFLVIDF